MIGFNKRERQIILYAYKDAARICWEREWEAHHGHDKNNGEAMANQLTRLMSIRANQILRYGCRLPKPKRLKSPQMSVKIREATKRPAKK